MSNPWGAPSSYLQDTGSLVSIYTKINSLHQSRQFTLTQTSNEKNPEKLAQLPSQIFSTRIFEILKLVKEYNKIKRTQEEKQTWSKFSDFVNQGPISNLISIIDQMGLYYEKFVQHRKDVIELINRESIDLHSSILLPFRLHQDFLIMLRSFAKEGPDGKFKKLQKITSLNPGVKTDVFCILENIQELREKVRVFAEMIIARDSQFCQIFEHAQASKLS